MNYLKILLFSFFILALAVPMQPAVAQDRNPQEVCGETYTVQRGDTLWAIASECGTTVTDILAVNPQITNPRLIFAGQRINIPGGMPIPQTGLQQSPLPVPVTGPGTSLPFYIVKPGDSLNYLADRYNTSAEDFQAANPLLREERLRVGMIIDLPGRSINQPTVIVSPVTGLPGAEVTVVAGGLPANAQVRIGAGRLGEGYFLLGTVTSDADGRIRTTIIIPQSANLDEVWRVVIDRPETNGIDAASNEFYVIQRGNRTQPVQYLVRPGDTMSWISIQFGLTIDEIMAVNPQITNPRRIITGSYVLIPGPDGQGVIPGTGQAHVSISPPSPVPGSNLNVLATGFPANTDVDIWIGRPGASPTIISSGRTNEQGVINVNLPVPADAQREQWVAYVVTRDRSVSALSSAFTVQAQQPIPVTGDPRDTLGSPAWRDRFENDDNWLVGPGFYTSSSIANGFMELTAHNRTDGWRITRPQVERFYLEMTVLTGEECSGGDRYGLFVNLPLDPEALHTGNQFGVTCNGHYYLRSWHAGTGSWLITPTPHDAINTGAEATNRLGIMVDGAELTLFINGERVAQATDNTYAGRGRFGIFVGAPETGEFTIYVDEIAYWNLP